MATEPPPGLNPGVALARRLLPPVLRDWVGRLGGELAEICGYHLGLADPAGVSGKLLRPALALLCSSATCGRSADVVPAAAAIELLHNASLIHDDIMDGDRERRHRPTVWARYGVPAAILAGDALIALAFEVLTSHRHPASAEATAVLSRSLRQLARGQDSDLRFTTLATVDPAECLTMIAGKAGALVGCACRLGVAYSPGPPDLVDRFERFGVHLGVALQLVDDVLGIWGDSAVTGKPAGSDLLARKKTAPVVAALAAGTAASARLAGLYARPDPVDVSLLAELVEAAGGRTWALAEADRQVSAAWDLLDGLGLDPVARSGLVSLTGALMNRDY
jgi:geranylgeranyl diphosphate synthase type I